MVSQGAYGLSRRVTLPYEEALKRVKDALKEEGFGVLTEIDVKDTLRQKLQVDFRKYDIIGACNPPLAHRALQSELEIGLLLPCNVIVQQRPSGSGAEVAAVDPTASMAAIDNPALKAKAAEIGASLRRALDRL